MNVMWVYCLSAYTYISQMLCVCVFFCVYACAVRVEASLEHWYVTGLQQQGIIPSLIASKGNLDSSLLSVLFELNPEDTAVDQLLHVHSQPVEIIYDAVSNTCKYCFYTRCLQCRWSTGFCCFHCQVIHTVLKCPFSPSPKNVELKIFINWPNAVVRVKLIMAVIKIII